MQRRQQLPLHGRQFQRCPVAAPESGHLHRHLFALEPGGYAAREYDHVDPLERFKQRGHGRGLAHQRASFKHRNARDPLAHSIREGHRVLGDGVVVAPHHLAVVRVRAHKRDSGVRRKGQHAAAVLQQHERLLRHLQAQRPMLGTLHQRVRQRVPFGRQRIQLAQPDSSGQQALETTVHVRFREQAFGHGLGDMHIRIAALQVRAGVDGFRHRVRGVRAVVVASGDIDIRNSPAIGDDKAFVAPFASQYGVDKVIVQTAWNAAETVVCNHHFPHARLGHKVLERRKIRLAQVALAHACIIGVAAPFRAGVHREVLGAGVGFLHPRVRRAL